MFVGRRPDVCGPLHLGQAGETELEEWGDRVLECRSLKDVFDGSV